jgi:phospholipase/lecithinase/hemolysin
MKSIAAQILPLAFFWVCPTLADNTPKFKSFSSVVIFGDSYTDQGVSQYMPGSNGEVGKPVRT